MNESIEALAAVIQIAVAPVFLLAGIAGFLGVMSGRLARIIDRGRFVEDHFNDVSSIKLRNEYIADIQILRRRSKIINWAIGMCTASALLVCMVVISLFVSDIFLLDLTNFIASFFVFALLCLIVALVLFLKEVQLATHVMEYKINSES